MTRFVYPAHPQRVQSMKISTQSSGPDSPYPRTLEAIENHIGHRQNVARVLIAVKISYRHPGGEGRVDDGQKPITRLLMIVSPHSVTLERSRLRTISGVPFCGASSKTRWVGRDSITCSGDEDHVTLLVVIISCYYYYYYYHHHNNAPQEFVL
uniref:Uncharacterized protein n=1 Tax=Anopheles coluzzii TaxID=1518534 RepID=A0A8W7P117_ANOCL